MWLLEEGGGWCDYWKKGLYSDYWKRVSVVTISGFRLAYNFTVKTHHSR